MALVKLAASKGAAAATTKAAVGKAGAVAANAASTYGVAATAATVTGALAVVGGIAWTVDTLDHASKAYECGAQKDWAGARDHLVSVLNSSAGIVSGADFADCLQAWHADGAPLDERVGELAFRAGDLARQAKREHEAGQATTSG